MHAMIRVNDAATAASVKALAPSAGLPSLDDGEAARLADALGRYERLVGVGGAAVPARTAAADRQRFAAIARRAADEGFPRFDEGEARSVLAALTGLREDKIRAFLYWEFVAIVASGLVECDPETAFYFAYLDAVGAPGQRLH